MYAQPEYATASELRYILNVMEERSHLGLDNASAHKIREVLVRRISRAENASAKKSVSSVDMSVGEPELLVH